MNCPNCNIELAAHALFCHRCGAQVPGSDATAGGIPRAVIPPEENADDVRDTPVARFLNASGGGGRRDPDDPEEEVWEGSYSPKAMISSWIAAGLLTIVLIVAAATSLNPWGGTGWLICLGVIAVGWVVLVLRLVFMRLNVRYRLTTQRFVHESGILRRLTDRIEVIDIDDVAFEQGLVDRFVSVGTIRLSTSDRSHEVLHLYGVDNVKVVAGMIDAERRKERVRRGLHIEAV